jgi:multiple sugar transport system substrate-binding protein
MNMRKFLTIVVFLSMLTGCANISALLSTPVPATAFPSTATPIIPTTPTASPTVTPGGPRTLRIWVPPQFDPSADTQAGALFQERLNEFIARRPNLQVEVRVKAETGDSGMLNALTTTKAAAPSIMPDLVALSRTDLESATAKGILHPFDGLSTLPGDSDWYPYARQMAHIQNSAFGLPFAGDAMILVGFRSPLPTSWQDLTADTLLIFPAADPNAFFTLSLYLSAGGTLQDSEGHLTVDESILADILSLYVPATDKTFVSPQAINYQDSDQAWNAFREQRGNLVVTWTSNYLNEKTIPLALAPLPGFDSGQYSLATGWSWALAGTSTDNQPLAVELAEFLSDSQFLAEWTQAAGYLPTRPTALASWSDAKIQPILKQVAETSVLVPSEDVLATVGPLFTEAALSVLKGEQLPIAAAQAAVQQVK